MFARERGLHHRNEEAVQTGVIGNIGRLTTFKFLGTELRFADFLSAIIDKKDLYPDLISTLIENLNILVPRSIGPPTRRKRERPGTAPWYGLPGDPVFE